MRKILIIDDDSAQRDLFNDYFIDCGYQTILAKDGAEGFAQLQKHQPDLVILDICMPNANGFHYLGEAQRIKDKTPVLAVTGKPGIKDAPELQFARQVKHCFIKPVHLLELRKLMEELLEESEAKDRKAVSLKKRLLRNEQAPVGSFFADCRIEELVGKGASGLVYKGNHLGMGIPVAIKIMDPRYNRSDQEKQRFLREVKILTRLEHKNLIQILNAGIEEDLYFMVMRYIDGMTAEQKLRSMGKLDIKTATEIIMQCAYGLQTAHGMELIHRDIKPSNILLNSDGSRVVVIDFGLARDFKKDVGLTSKDMVLGTPYYMSPEQCLGVPLDHRTDIYSLGATYYHLVIGQPPFSKGSAVDTMMAHTSQIPVPPHDIDKDIPLKLSQIILKMLKKAPSQRPPDTTALIDELNAIKTVWAF